MNYLSGQVIRAPGDRSNRYLGKIVPMQLRIGIKDFGNCVGIVSIPFYFSALNMIGVNFIKFFTNGALSEKIESVGNGREAKGVLAISTISCRPKKPQFVIV